MLTSQQNFEFMINENEKKDKNKNLSKPDYLKKNSDNTISIYSENPGEISELSALSSQLHEEKNKDFYEMKSQYLSDEIFFAKLHKKTFNDPLLITSNQMSLNHEHEESTNKFVGDSEKKKISIDFLRTGSLNTTVVLLMVATIGGGLLSIPTAFYYSGKLGGFVFFFIFAIMTYYSTYLLVEACDLCKRYSYCGLAEACAPNKYLSFLVKVIYFVNNWGILTLYIIRVNQLLSTFFSHFTEYEFLAFYENMSADPKCSWKFFEISIMVVFVLPQSLFRQYSSLRYGYFVGICFLLYLTVSIVISSLFSLDFYSNMANLDYFTKDELSFYITIFAYTCHNNLPDIFAELKHSSKKIMTKALMISFTICMVIYLFIGFFASVFLNKRYYKSDNFLSEYTSFYMQLAILLYALYVVFIMPLKLKPCKDTLLDIFFPNQQRDDFKKHFILTLISGSLCLIPAMFIDDPTRIIQAMGILSNPLVCFTFPTIFFWRLNKNKDFSWLQKFIFFLFIFVIPLYGIFELAYGLALESRHF